MEFYTNNKYKINYIILCVLSFVCLYLSIRFLLPILFPFILGFLLSKLILPIVNFLNHKLNFHRTTANIIAVFLLIVVLVTLAVFITSKLTLQVSTFIKNWSFFETEVSSIAKNCCCFLGDFIGVSGDEIYISLSRQVNSAISSVSSQIVPAIMNYSIATIKGFFDFFIFALAILISLFFFSRDNKKINTFLLNCKFKREIIFIRKITKNVVMAYIKTQLIIISSIALVCTVGFTILKNPYSILYGILIGILDFLPLIGAGTFLVPMSIYYCLKGNIFATAITFILFIICYLIREILEPRLMGGTMGIHPLVSLISIFTGYKLFGIWGMILGPFAYVFVIEILKCYDKIYYNKINSE